MMIDVPDDATDCWIIRIGGPEKPFRATYLAATTQFLTQDLDVPLYLPSFLVLKWRAQNP